MTTNDAPLCEMRVPGLAPFSMRAHHRPDRFITRDLVNDGIWEPFETEVALSRLRPGGVFVDVGANIGYYTIVASMRVGPAGAVHAFEPEPGNFAILQENARLNGLANARLNNVALDTTSREATLFLSEVNQGDHRLYCKEEGRRTVPVRTTSLDEYFAPRPPAIDLVKMDTQGAEARIVAGMEGILRSQRGRLAIILEYWPYGLSGADDDPAGLAALLEPHGFELFEISETERRLAPTSWKALLRRAAEDLEPGLRRFTNVLLAPPAR